jgi:hypothetical protein
VQDSSHRNRRDKALSKAVPTALHKLESEGLEQSIVNQQVLERLGRIEILLHDLKDAQTIKESYTTAEIAQLLGKAEFTLREWCRHGRVHATKRPCGRGCSKQWAISHAELQRIRNEGLLSRSEH